MKTVWQSLKTSYILYGFFILLGLMTGMKASELSLTQFASQLLSDYGLVLVVLHALYILVFIYFQSRVNRLHQQPLSSHDKLQGEAEERKAKGWLSWAGLANVGGIVILSGLAFYFAGHSVKYTVATALTLLFSFLILVGSGANSIIQNYLHFLRKALAKTVDDVLAEKRAPVLYLRSFLDDQVAANREVSLLTEEEELNKAFEMIGPMIAIGKPGEVLPEAGAARAYFTNDQWQAAVYRYMDISRLVVLRAGFSQGLLWEIRNSIQRLDPCKFVLLIPFRKEEYEQFRANVQSLFPKPLPDHPGHEVHRITKEPGYEGQTAEVQHVYGSLFGLIHFDGDWTPHFEKICGDHVPLSGQMLVSKMKDKSMLASNVYLMVHYALRPVYERLGMTWDDLGVPWVA